MNVIDRFLKYVSFDTKSNESSESSESCPSTEGQRTLGAYLVKEMQEIGLCEVGIDENGYVYGFLPASEGCEELPVRGLIAHMDTSPDASGQDVKPCVLTYTGGDIRLSNGTLIEATVFPALSRYVGQELIVTDGNTLLGADDKAGIAEILSACAYFVKHPEIKHGKIAVAFTPDEEIGRGADRFDLVRFAAKAAYTVDGEELGEIEYENFNAASADVTVRGVNVHPGSAKGRMKNAILMAHDFIAQMPAEETPAHTEGYEGFYHIHDFSGDETETSFSMLIRDHDRTHFEDRKAFLCDLCERMNQKWGNGSFSVAVRDSYYNMREKILPHMHLIEAAERAMKQAGVEPRIVPVRGGTDGARLSYMGLPCPNLSTGGMNFHGVREMIPVASMEKMVNVLVHLMSAELS